MTRHYLREYCVNLSISPLSKSLVVAAIRLWDWVSRKACSRNLTLLVSYLIVWSWSLAILTRSAALDWLIWEAAVSRVGRYGVNIACCTGGVAWFVFLTDVGVEGGAAGHLQRLSLAHVLRRHLGRIGFWKIRRSWRWQIHPDRPASQWSTGYDVHAHPPLSVDNNHSLDDFFNNLHIHLLLLTYYYLLVKFIW